MLYKRTFKMSKDYHRNWDALVTDDESDRDEDEGLISQSTSARSWKTAPQYSCRSFWKRLLVVLKWIFLFWFYGPKLILERCIHNRGLNYPAKSFETALTSTDASPIESTIRENRSYFPLHFHSTQSGWSSCSCRPGMPEKVYLEHHSPREVEQHGSVTREYEIFPDADTGCVAEDTTSSDAGKVDLGGDHEDSIQCSDNQQAALGFIPPRSTNLLEVVTDERRGTIISCVEEDPALAQPCLLESSNFDGNHHSSPALNSCVSDESLYTRMTTHADIDNIVISSLVHPNLKVDDIMEWEELDNDNSMSGTQGSQRIVEPPQTKETVLSVEIPVAYSDKTSETLDDRQLFSDFEHLNEGDAGALSPERVFVTDIEKDLYQLEELRDNPLRKRIKVIPIRSDGQLTVIEAMLLEFQHRDSVELIPTESFLQKTRALAAAAPAGAKIVTPPADSFWSNRGRGKRKIKWVNGKMESGSSRGSSPANSVSSLGTKSDEGSLKGILGRKTSETPSRSDGHLTAIEASLLESQQRESVELISPGPSYVSTLHDKEPVLQMPQLASPAGTKIVTPPANSFWSNRGRGKRRIKWANGKMVPGSSRGSSTANSVSSLGTKSDDGSLKGGSKSARRMLDYE